MNRWYPDTIVAGSIDQYLPQLADPACTTGLIKALERLFAGADRSLLNFAEIGVWQGATTGQLAKFLGNRGTLHIFDYEDTVSALRGKLLKAGFTNVTAWGNSHRYLDSYNWSLRQILEKRPDLRFDYIFIDGAHTWAIDALTFLLCDLLLNVGGYIYFDDYGWRLRGSSLDPERVPVTGELYTDAQIDDFQVKAIVDLLVRRRGTYREIVKNVLFQKVASTASANLVAFGSGAGCGRVAEPPRATPSIGAPHLFDGECEVMQRIMCSGYHRYHEFGIGGSTLMAIRSGFQSVVAIDSDREWVGAARTDPEIDAAIKAGRADIRHADIGPVGSWGYPSDPGHIRDWSAYIATGWDAWAARNEVPDLIFVDGRFRVACCLSAILLYDSVPGQIQEPCVMLHDVGPERPYYNAVFEFFDVIESVNTLRILRIKPDICHGRVMSALLRLQFDQR
jgi:hypothetical protein